MFACDVARKVLAWKVLDIIEGEFQGDGWESRKADKALAVGPSTSSEFTPSTVGNKASVTAPEAGLKQKSPNKGSLGAAKAFRMQEEERHDTSSMKGVNMTSTTARSTCSSPSSMTPLSTNTPLRP